MPASAHQSAARQLQLVLLDLNLPDINGAVIKPVEATEQLTLVDQTLAEGLGDLL